LIDLNEIPSASWGRQPYRKLEQWRKANDLSQEAAAERLGVPIGTFRGWEQGRREPIGLAMRVILQTIEKDTK